jgi:2-polyprenyl-3-methyl-5-hydroxy-6-metoxy-1,4-benzoquinol methylase
MSYYREQLETYLKEIRLEPCRVLDVGGGEKRLQGRVKNIELCDYLVFDNNAEFNPDIFADINYYFKELHPEKRFDVVFCLEVMEYVFDPVTVHRNIFNFLKDAGVAYISYPTIYPLHNPPGIDYLRYSKNAIEKLLAEVGFQTWEITPRVATEGALFLQKFYTSEGMHPMKNTDEIYHIGYLVKCFKKGANL